MCSGNATLLRIRRSQPLCKSSYVYLQMMKLEVDHPDINKAFQGGLHVLRRNDRYWAGLLSDLVIEQVLMRSVKTAGGLTRGRGMTEVQRPQWLLSMPNCRSQRSDAVPHQGTVYNQ
jgi:hypothetical protein